MRSGRLMVPVIQYDMGDEFMFRFGFNTTLKDHIKGLKGSRWNPNNKSWTVPKSDANDFQLAYLRGENVYQDYDKPLIQHPLAEGDYGHQGEMFDFMMTRHYCIVAGEMGVGKTKPAIRVINEVKAIDCWYIAPKATLTAIEVELRKWKCHYVPKLLTYEGLVKTMKHWKGGLAPQLIIGDEISKCKSHKSQRYQAMQALADGVRKDWGSRGYVLLMSGSPAPKSPADWWALCSIACPGFLKETDPLKFERRLSIQQQMEGSDGVKFNRIVGWKDSTLKCATCGKEKNDYLHSPEAQMLETNVAHEFFAAENEVEKLHGRLKGLVYVKFKKDCLDLPEKVYRTVKVKSSIQTLNAARLLVSAVTGAQLLMKLRELSDGFQYQSIRGDPETCPRCEGKRQKDGEPCHACEGTGTIRKKTTKLYEVACPKDQAVNDLIEEHEDDGRLVLYGGFTPSIDRLVRLVTEAGWHYIRVDGRGWDSDIPNAGRVHLLDIFADPKGYDKVAFIGHPGSAGMGLTLTASKTIVYYSNDFNAESRIQSEDRIHRLGSRGANIIDIVHLPTDQRILDSLKMKRDLQSISLGELKEALENDELPSSYDSDE